MYVKARLLNNFVIFPNFMCLTCSQLPHVCIWVILRTWKCINILASIDVMVIFGKKFEGRISVFFNVFLFFFPKFKNFDVIAKH